MGQGNGKKLLHEHVDFAEGGGAHAIVHEGDERVYFRLGTPGPGIVADVGGELSVPDAEKLVALLQHSIETVKQNIERHRLAKTTEHVVGDVSPAVGEG